MFLDRYMHRASKVASAHLELAKKIKQDTQKIKKEKDTTVRSFLSTANSVEKRVLSAVQGPVLDLVTE